MRTPRVWWLGWLVLLSGLIVLPLTHGQVPPRAVPPRGSTPEPAAKDIQPDPGNLGPLARQMFFNARRGTEWLFRANRPDGRFVDGLRPELNAAFIDTHYLRQLAAARSLAEAALYFKEERYAARARQAVLALLLETSLDPADGTSRQPTLPVDRLAATGGLLAAIAALPQPGTDLLTQTDQLASYLRRQLQADGTIRLDEPRLDAEAAALYGLIRSHQIRPAPWKLNVLRQALPPYRAAWRENKTLEAVPPQIAAFTEAYLVTQETAFAEYVFELADWLLTKQIKDIDPRTPLWLGGFRTGAADEPPQAVSAQYAACLVDACRAAQAAGDLEHYRRCRDGLERGLQFLATLQYTEANTQHFADWYRPTVLGGFFAAHQDGYLRLDFTAHALSALVGYLKLGD